MISTPGLTELNAFMAVASRKGFRAAAIDLGLSASAVSHAVASLEARLGVRLLNRTTRSVSLTSDGEQFLARIAPAMQEITHAMSEANERRSTPAGLIRISTSERAGEQLLSSVAIEFLRQYPDMQMEIVAEGRLVDIVAEGFDAGVRLRDMVPLDMIAVPFGKAQRHIVVAAPSYLVGRQKPKMPTDLKDHVCIRYRLPGGSTYAWEFHRRGEAMQIDVHGPLTLNSDRLVLRAALDGAGLAYVNEWSVRNAIADGRLVQLLSDWTLPYPGLCLYYPRHRHMAAGMRAFVALVRAINAADPGAAPSAASSDGETGMALSDTVR
ncbi:LysR family transcriptional regulator [Sphingobium sp.]|uniref:LysR family transcriptional regulator n=1 Tax=Sphingobium sp. TaxID=1912891 RepID=UPI003B3ABD11